MTTRLRQIGSVTAVLLPFPTAFVRFAVAVRNYRNQTTAAERASGRTWRRETLAKRVEEGSLPSKTVAVRVAEGLVLLGVLIAFDYALFHWLFGTNYLRWYLANGAIITLSFAILSTAVGLDAVPELISRNPLVFVGGTTLLWSLLSASWATMLRVKSPREKLLAGEAENLEEAVGPLGWPHRAAELLDLLLVALFQQVLVFLVLAWVVFVMPLQYFLNLVCGAASRMSLAATSIAVYDPAKYETTLGVARGTEIPKGAIVLGYGERPVTFTATLGAGVLWVINRLV